MALAAQVVEATTPVCIINVNEFVSHMTAGSIAHIGDCDDICGYGR